MRPLAQARNPYSRSWLWIQGSSFGRPGMTKVRGRSLRRRPLRLRPPQMLVQPRHDLDEIAGPRAVVELGGEDAVPAVTASARRTRQTEDEGRAGDTRGRSALDRRGADLGVAQHMEGDGKTIPPLF